MEQVPLSYSLTLTKVKWAIGSLVHVVREVIEEDVQMGV